MSKRCAKCKEIKELNQFGVDSSNKNGLRSRCKVCRSIDAVIDHKKHNEKVQQRLKNSLNYHAELAKIRDKQKDNMLRSKYGITLKDFDCMLHRQNNRCAICKQLETRIDKTGVVADLSVDHCHFTNKVRGLLCNSCNQGIGRFGDVAEFCYSAGDYLTNPPGVIG